MINDLDSYFVAARIPNDIDFAKCLQGEVDVFNASANRVSLGKRSE